MPFEKKWLDVCVLGEASVHHVIKILEASNSKICLVVSKMESSEKLLGTITDGDIRRAILGGIDLSSECCAIMNENPYSAKGFLSTSELDKVLVEHLLKHLPIVSVNDRLLGLYYSEILVSDAIKNCLFVIMAGGFGNRLKPYTETTPKPMLEVNGKPMLQHIIERARASGVQNFALILHYLPDQIQEYFGDGSDFGVSIEYVVENEPLGTVGGISLLNMSNKNYSSIIVTNGDVLSDVDYKDILQYHLKQHAFATMAVQEHRLINEFGTVEISGNVITGFKEKPITRSNINAGIYVLSNEVLNLLTKGNKKNMPDLFMDAVDLEHRIVAYYLFEEWNDVGRVSDFKRVNKV